MWFLNALVMSSILLTYWSRYENCFRFALSSPFLFTICGRYFLALNSIAIAIHHSFPFLFLPIINHFLHTFTSPSLFYPQTAIHSAVLLGKFECFRVLVYGGADVKIPNVCEFFVFDDGDEYVFVCACVSVCVIFLERELQWEGVKMSWL